MLTELKENKVSVEMLLKQLHRVSQVDFKMDQDVQVWYVGMQKKTEKILEQTGRKNSLVRGSSMPSDHFEAVQSLQIPVYFTTPIITFRPTINGGSRSGTGVTLLPSMISRKESLIYKIPTFIDEFFKIVCTDPELWHMST